MQQEQNAPQIIKTIGEQGEEIFMKLLEIVTVNDKDYALLSLVEEDTLPNSDNDEDEIVRQWAEQISQLTGLENRIKSKEAINI